MTRSRRQYRDRMRATQLGTLGDKPGVAEALDAMRAGLPEDPQSPTYWRRVWST